MANGGRAEIEARDRPCRRVELDDAADVQRELGVVFRAGKERQRAHLSDAVDALVDQVRKAGTHFREGAELPAADAYLRADEPFEPPAAVLRLQQQGRDAPARDLLAPIYARFTEGFATADLEAAKALLESARIA